MGNSTICWSYFARVARYLTKTTFSWYVVGCVTGPQYSAVQGDFVDRGHHSVETLQLLMCYKARYVARVADSVHYRLVSGIPSASHYYEEIMKVDRCYYYYYYYYYQ